MGAPPSLTVDGLPVTAEDLAHQALVNYGAYTSFGIEGGGARGLTLHLDRLETEAVELFGLAVGVERLRGLMRQALLDRRDAWMRVGLFSPEIGPRTPDWHGVPKVMVGVFAPVAPVAETVRLQPQLYAREMPHLKHAATLGLIRARRLARQAGHDDALFVDADGRISEGSLWNVGFLDGDQVIWPRAPMLQGVTQALIQRGLEAVGMQGRTEVVTLDGLGRFDGAFICNSATPACAVTAIGDRGFAVDPGRMARLREAWLAAPVEAI